MYTTKAKTFEMKPVPSVKLMRFFPFRPGSDPSAATPRATTSPRPCLYSAGSILTCPTIAGPTPAGSSVEPSYAVDSPWITEAERIGYSYIMPLICMAGIILNSLTILVLTRKVFRAPTYTYLMALAAADIWTAVFTLPIGAIRCGPCLPENNGYNRLLYEIFIYVPLTNMSENVSAWMTLVLAVDRVMTLKKPPHERALLRNRRRAVVIILGVVSAALLLNLPFFFAMDIAYSQGEYQAYFTGFGNGQGFVIFSWIRAVLVQFIPLILLTFLNIHLIMQVRESGRKCKGMSLVSPCVARERAQRRLTSMLIGTIIMFILGHIPIAFAYTVIFQAVFGEEKTGGSFYANWRVTTHLIAMTSYALDFVVYCLVNRFFREATVTLFTCHRGQRRVTDVSSESAAPQNKKSDESDCSAKTKKTSLDKSTEHFKY